MIEVGCQCGTRLSLPDEFAGKQGRCPRCERVLDVPAIEPAIAEKRQVEAPPPGDQTEQSLTPQAISPPMPTVDHTTAGGATRWTMIGSVAGAAVVLVVLLLWMGRGDPASPEGVPSANVDPALEEPAETESSSTGRSARPTPTSPAIEAPVVKPEAPQAGIAPAPPVEPNSESPTANARPRPQPPTTERGLSGASTQYDDDRCHDIQLDHGIRVPASATILEVDGVRLPVEGIDRLRESRSPILFLPEGTHAIRFRPGERLVEVTIAKPLRETYDQMRGFFAVSSRVRTAELLSRGARAMDAHKSPFLLNFHGAAYAAEGHWDAAERKFRRALRVNPAFSPAHLNLAYALARRGDYEEARREVLLAEAFNVGNVFGLRSAIINQRRELAIPEDAAPVEHLPEVYVSTEPQTDEDRRLVALLLAIGKYAVADSERAKIRNNLGAHFAESGRPLLALEHFRGALAALRSAGPERYELARQVLGHMSQTCREAEFVEADEYESMQRLVRP